jgi:hypothetical protein
MEKDTNIKRGITEFPMNRESPFLDNLVFPTRRTTIALAKSQDKGLLDKVTGEIDDTLFIATKRDLDKEEFVKIFQSELKTIFDLSKKALKVLSYFMNVSGFGDELDFDIEDCLEFTGYSSKQTIVDSIVELLDKEIVARGKNPYKYYANPKIFYKGDRIVLISDYRLKKKGDISAANQMNLFESSSSK